MATPTHAQLEVHLKDLLVQKLHFKEQIEMVDKQVAIVSGQMQLLKAQEQPDEE